MGDSVGAARLAESPDIPAPGVAVHAPARAFAAELPTNTVQWMATPKQPGPGTMIPIYPARDTEVDSLCGSGEAFALMVLGESMAPEFVEGDIVIVEPEGLARDGSYVLAEAGGELIFRCLHQQGSGWRLLALQPGHPEYELADLACVRGVIIQKSRPGRRRETRRYVE